MAFRGFKMSTFAARHASRQLPGLIKPPGRACLRLELAAQPSSESMAQQPAGKRTCQGFWP